MPQSIPSIRVIVVFSVRAANHATKHSKSHVNSEPGLANGTPSARAPCTGQTPQTPPPAADLKPPDPQIQMPPDRVPRPRVLPRTSGILALRANQPAAAQRDLDAHPPRLEADIPDPHALQVHKPGKCRLDAHAVLPCKPLTFEQPAACLDRRRRVTNQHATCVNSPRPRKRCSGPQTGAHPDHTDPRSPRKNARFVATFGAATAEAESPRVMASPIIPTAATNALRIRPPFPMLESTPPLITSWRRVGCAVAQSCRCCSSACCRRNRRKRHIWFERPL